MIKMRVELLTKASDQINQNALNKENLIPQFPCYKFEFRFIMNKRTIANVRFPSFLRRKSTMYSGNGHTLLINKLDIVYLVHNVLSSTLSIIMPDNPAPIFYRLVLFIFQSLAKLQIYALALP